MASEGAATFSTTRWDLVFAARDACGTQAREELARTYWLPLYAFARLRGLTPEDAADVVQSYLGRLVRDSALATVSREGGRLRDFLRKGLQNELIDQHRSEHAARRRPVNGFVPLNLADVEGTLDLATARGRTPEEEFDVRWALAVLDVARTRLEREYVAAGESELFQYLFARLDDARGAMSHTEAANRLGLDEGTLKNKGTRLRKRFRELLEQHVADTLASADSSVVNDELRHLQAALRG